MTQSKRLSTASAMYDQGNKGYLNKSEKLMRELDADGDGILSRVELEAAAKKIMSAKKTAGQWRLITSMLVVALGVAFGMNLFSNEISKDVKPNADGELLTFNYGAGAGKMVTTQQAEAFTSLLDLPRLSITSLQEVKVLTIVLESGEEWLIRVASISKLECGNSLVIYGQSGDEIHINGATGAAYAMVRDNERHVITAGAFHKRRLAAGNSQVAYSREEFFSNGMGFNNGRRLSKAEGGQQGWASLSQSKNSVVTESPSCPIDYNNSGVVGVGMSDNYGFQFTKIGDTRVMVSTNGKSGSVYTDGMMYRFDNGELDRCRKFDLWNDQTDLINGNPGRDDWKFDTQATFEYSASKKAMDFHIPTRVECEVANASYEAQMDSVIQNLDYTVERTEEEKKRNLAKAKGTSAHFNKFYAEVTEEWLNEPHNAEAKRMLGGGWGGWNPPSPPPPLSPNWSQGRLANETIFAGDDAYVHYDNPTTGAQFRLPHQCIGIWRGSDEGVDWAHNILGSWNDTSFAGNSVHGGFVVQFLDTEENFIRDNMASTASCLRYQFQGNSLGGGLSEISGEYYGSPTTDLCMQNPTGGATAQAVNCLYMPVKLFTTGCPRVYVNSQSSYGTTNILAGTLRAFHKWDFVPTISPWYYHRTTSKSIKDSSRGVEGNSCQSSMTLSSGYCKSNGCKSNGIDLGFISDTVFPFISLQGEARISPTARWCYWRTNNSWRRGWCAGRYAVCRLQDGCNKARCWYGCWDEHTCLGVHFYNNMDASRSYTAAGRQDNGPYTFPHASCGRGLFTNGGALAIAAAIHFITPLVAPLGNLSCLLAIAASAAISPLLRNFSVDDHAAGIGYLPYYNVGWFNTDYAPFGIDYEGAH